MNKLFKHSITGLIIMILSGCVLSKFPIDDPALIKIDPRLLGRWVANNDGTIYTVTRQDDCNYFVTYKDKQKKKLDRSRAFLSDINNNWFLNIQVNDDSSHGFFFLKILRANPAYDTVTAVSVSDSMIKYLGSVAEVRAYVTRNLNSPAFFSDTTHLYKLPGSKLSLYPINDPAKIKIDARLLGKWKAKNKNGSNLVYSISKKDRCHYLIAYKGDSKKKTGKRIAFLSQVNNAWFLNMYCKEVADEGYTFMKFLGTDPSYNKVTAVAVSDSSFTSLNSSAEVRNLILKNLNNRLFYGDTTRLLRVN